MFINNGPRQSLLKSINMSVQTIHITEIYSTTKPLIYFNSHSSTVFCTRFYLKIQTSISKFYLNYLGIPDFPILQ